VLLESQCEFRSGKKCKCKRGARNKICYFSQYFDPSKAFDIVYIASLWQVPKKFDCTDKFVYINEAPHTGMQANVAVSGFISNNFAVTNGVKQSCVLAPTLFSLYRSAMLKVAFKDSSEGVS